MLLAADYPFLEVVWTMLIFFAWVIWFWMLIAILSDVFRRRDMGGGKKTLWVLFVVFLPFLGVLVYLLVNHDSIAERRAQDERGARRELDEHIRSVSSGGSAAEIEKGKQLLDAGAITQEEFDAIKARALA